MCSAPKPPKAENKPKPLRILLSRDRLDKGSGGGGATPADLLLPKRDQSGNSLGVLPPAGLNVV